MFEFNCDDYWEFKTGITVEGNGCDTFVVKLINGEFLGRIICGDSDDYRVRVADLNNGIDPITGNWEDGIGNPCELSGWGSPEE